MATHDDAFILDAHDGLDRLGRLLEDVEDGGPGSEASAAEAAEVCRGLFESAAQLRHGRIAAPARNLLVMLEFLSSARGGVPEAEICRLLDAVDALRETLVSLEQGL